MEWTAFPNPYSEQYLHPLLGISQEANDEFGRLVEIVDAVAKFGEEDLRRKWGRRETIVRHRRAISPFLLAISFSYLVFWNRFGEDGGLGLKKRASGLRQSFVLSYDVF